MCEHNTGGTHCDSCETGFNAIQWSPGIETDANVCQRKSSICTSVNPGNNAMDISTCDVANAAGNYSS